MNEFQPSASDGGGIQNSAYEPFDQSASFGRRFVLAHPGEAEARPTPMAKMGGGRWCCDLWQFLRLDFPVRGVDVQRDFEGKKVPYELDF